MTDPIKHIPLDAIAEDALIRDRIEEKDDDGLRELRTSILAGGLRMPIEVFEIEPQGKLEYGLISGYRRLAAYRALHADTGQERWAAIPTFVRAPQSVAAAMTAMVEENDIRAELSPWERARIALVAAEREIFASVDEAIARLYPNANKFKRSRLRSLADLVETLEDLLIAPETLSERQALRLAAAVRAGLGPVMRAALDDARVQSPGEQWQLLLPYLVEVEEPQPEKPRAPGRPRRLLPLRYGLNIRRERTRDGYAIHFTGKEADSDFCDRVFDEIERLFAPVDQPHRHRLRAR